MECKIEGIKSNQEVYDLIEGSKAFIVIVNNGDTSQSILDGTNLELVQSLISVIATHPTFGTLVELAQAYLKEPETNG
jgi:hypothetical protein